MAKSENNKKVPGALVAAVVVVVAIAAFVPTVYMPYKNKKPGMDSEHQEALDTIAYYEDSIADQENIEAEIADLTAQWEKYRKSMFVEPQTALNDLNTALDNEGITVLSYKQEDAKPDESETVTAEGNPLYYVPINIECQADRDQLLNFLKYVEKESVGAYFVKNLESEPSALKDSDGMVTGTTLKVKMDVYLYYFNQDIKIEAETSDTDTAEE